MSWSKNMHTESLESISCCIFLHNFDYKSVLSISVHSEKYRKLSYYNYFRPLPIFITSGAPSSGNPAAQGWKSFYSPRACRHRLWTTARLPMRKVYSYWKTSCCYIRLIACTLGCLCLLSITRSCSVACKKSF